MALFQDGCSAGCLPANYSLGYSVRLAFGSRWYDSSQSLVGLLPKILRFKPSRLLGIQSKSRPTLNHHAEMMYTADSYPSSQKQHVYTQTHVIICSVSSGLWMSVAANLILSPRGSHSTCSCVGAHRRRKKQSTFSPSTGRLKMWIHCFLL